MRPAFRRSIAILCFALFVPARGHALADNVVRVDRFDWMKVETEHFDVYYDKKTAPMVPQIADYLEKTWQDVGDRFGYFVPARTPFFFFSDHNRFEQTNVVSIGEGTGGVTEAFKNRFLVYNDGSAEWLRHVIPHEFAHVMQFNVLYTGVFRSVQLFIKSPFYPLWWMEGMAEYGSGSIDNWTTDVVVRDAVASKTLIGLPELHGFSHLKPNQVTLGYKTGEAAMEFLADEYGKDKALALLVSMRDHFDISSGLGDAIAGRTDALDIYRFDFRFREWLDDHYAEDIAASKQPSDYGVRVTSPDGIPLSNQAPTLSPDGKKIYYMSDQTGPVRVYEVDVASKKSSALFSLDWEKFEALRDGGRGLSISRDGRWLAFSGERVQRDYLFLYDLKRRKLKRVKIPFDEIRSPVFSPVDDNQLVCVGLNNGYTDLYLIGRDGRVTRRLTNTPQHELDPAYSPDGGRVFFSGEMLTAGGDPAGRDIFSFDLVTSSLTQVTSFAGRETEPEPLPDGSLAFIRNTDDDGRLGSEIFRLTPGAENPEQLTRLVGGAFSPRYSASLEKLFFVGFNAGERHVYEGNWDLRRPPPPALTIVEDEPIDGDEPESVSMVSTFSPTEWPAAEDSPLLRGPAKPYRFKGSTDLFLPFFLYSTQSGFAAVALWQYSDMLGDHTLQQQAQYASGADFYDVSTFYTYAGYRPRFTFGGTAQRYYRDFDQQEQRRELNGVFVVDYPLSRVNSILLGVGATSREDRFLDDTEINESFQDRYYSAGLSYDTVTGRYLIPVRGRRLSLVYQQGGNSVGGNQSYKTGAVQGVQYFPLPRESTFATRLFYGRSVGRQPQVFRLGGVDRLRGVSNTDANKKQNAVYGSGELRLRIAYLNARTKFLFPDFFFKAAYLIAFDDVGFGWDTPGERNDFKARDLENSAGAGISWPMFILQTYKLDLTILWAKQTSTGRDTWYITLGPAF